MISHTPTINYLRSSYQNEALGYLDKERPAHRAPSLSYMGGRPVFNPER